jgi:predicted metal-dependent peptidase
VSEPKADEAEALAKVKSALRLVSVSLPHLAGLARLVRISIDPRIGSAGIFASGRLVVSPEFLGQLDLGESAFVMAHELLHLALRTHERGTGSDRLLVNYAHDYIINDILTTELGRPIPAGGLEMPGAREMSLEKLMEKLKSDPELRRARFWGLALGHGPGRPTVSEIGRVLQDALRKAGHDVPEAPPVIPGRGDAQGDVLDTGVEREWFPDADPIEEQRRRRQVRREAVRSASLGTLIGELNRAERDRQPGQGSGGAEQMVDAVRDCYVPPWESALQRWLDAVSPGPRTYARPSRRGADRTDLVLPGRRRDGWTLHVVLDTSGSMSADIPRCLGAIALYGESVGIEEVHVLQCDVTVTRDEFVPLAELARYTVAGYGGSDMSPAMRRLADDLEVEAVVVLTDGCIEYPPPPLPYEVLWVLPPGENPERFRPGYGKVLALSAI